MRRRGNEGKEVLVGVLSDDGLGFFGSQEATIEPQLILWFAEIKIR